MRTPTPETQGPLWVVGLHEDDEGTAFIGELGGSACILDNFLIFEAENIADAHNNSIRGLVTEVRRLREENERMLAAAQKGIAEVETDNRFRMPPASVKINAPLALVQVELESRRHAFQDVLAALGEETTEERSARVNGPSHWEKLPEQEARDE